MHTGVWWEIQKEKEKWEDTDNTKMDLRETGWCSMDWIHLTHDRDQWRALVNTIMSLRVPQNVGEFWSN
jgi:hypothetical protein